MWNFHASLTNYALIELSHLLRFEHNCLQSILEESKYPVLMLYLHSQHSIHELEDVVVICERVDCKEQPKPQKKIFQKLIFKPSRPPASLRSS